MILLDTSVLSLCIRRDQHSLSSSERIIVRRAFDIIAANEATIIGPIRQEVLSGVRNPSQFDVLKRAIDGLNDTPLTASDFDRAAQFFNACRSRGVTPGHVDMTICSTCVANQLPVLTVDLDFNIYAGIIPITLA